MAESMFDALLKQPRRMGARTQSRNTLGINHPLSESSAAARIPISMLPFVGGAASGYTQEDLATLALPEETTLFSPLGFNITDKNLARFGLTMDALDWVPGAAVLGGLATGAGLLGRAVKGNRVAPESDEMMSAMLGPAMQRQGLLDDAMVGGDAGAAALARIGNTAPQQAMELAEQMESAGRSRDEIWAATADLGYPVFRGPDGKLKFEIDDSAVRLKEPPVGKTVPVYESIIHPEMQQAYPDSGVRIGRVDPGTRDLSGYFDPATKEIRYGGDTILNTNPVLKRILDTDRSTALHELQHATQEAEGFARGGSPGGPYQSGELDRLIQRKYEQIKKLPGNAGETKAALYDHAKKLVNSDEGRREIYRALAGEAEARQVQARMDMSPAERAYKPFYADFDVPEADQLVRYGDGPSAMVTEPSVDEFVGKLLDDGLPMDEASRMQRAQDMGFDTGTTLYHGTPDARGIHEDGFSVLTAKGRKPGPTFFSDDYKTAASYADDSRAWDYQNAEPETIKAFIKQENPLVVDAAGETFRGIDPDKFLSGVSPGPRKENMERIVRTVVEGTGGRLITDDAVSIAKQFDYDGLVIRNVVDDYAAKGKPSNIMVTFNPNQIRSPAAAFDPAKRNSANLLATAAPIAATGLLSANALRGLYEPDALKDDEAMRRALLRN